MKYTKQQLMIDARSLMIEYLKAIDDDSDIIQAVYQNTLNEGFRNMFICVAVFNLIVLILLFFYKDDRKTA